MPQPYRSPETKARSEAFWSAHDEAMRQARERQDRRDKQIAENAISEYKAQLARKGQ